jgi:hypothetical protein
MTIQIDRRFMPLSNTVQFELCRGSTYYNAAGEKLTDPLAGAGLPS